jgi:dUTPase
MQRQDITFRIVVKDPELKALYKESLANYKFGDRGFDLIVPRYTKIYVGSRSNKVDHEIQVAGYYIYPSVELYAGIGTVPPLITAPIEHEVGYDLRLRSGTGAKTAFRLSNEVGTIDLYRGNIMALIDHIVSYTQADLFSGTSSEELQVCAETGKQFVAIKAGTRLVQLVNPNGYGCKVEFVDELPPTERGDAGFGSSGF